MIEKYSESQAEAYSEFLSGQPGANYCHDAAWIRILREGYGKEAFILIDRDGDSGGIRGAASACALRSVVFGNQLVCLPYLDYGGILAEDAKVQEGLRGALVAAAAGRPLELRGLVPLSGLPQAPNIKTAMMLTLPAGGHDAYWKSLDAKVRNQVRKAEKSSVSVVWGREERLDDFYRVFCVNMRDLGSPTHSRAFFSAVLRHLPGAEIGTAHRAGRCIGGLFRINWRKTLAIPWASTLKEERSYCPNNALYWETIRFAFEQGCARVDFGRSSRDEGTYKFKGQWLAKEAPLHWYQIDGQGRCKEAIGHASSGKMSWASSVWKRLPLPVANFIGARIRGSIPA